MLYENGFLIDDDVDEISLLKEKYWINRYCKDTLYLSILTTQDCNFACPYCFESKVNRSSLQEPVQTNILSFIKKELQHYKALSINWYGGEPLLNMSAIENMSKPIMELYATNGKAYYET